MPEKSHLDGAQRFKLFIASVGFSTQIPNNDLHATRGYGSWVTCNTRCRRRLAFNDAGRCPAARNMERLSLSDLRTTAARRLQHDLWLTRELCVYPGASRLPANLAFTGESSASFDTYPHNTPLAGCVQKSMKVLASTRASHGWRRPGIEQTARSTPATARYRLT